MENASKALIIAGAILLAILLISMGVMVFQQASGITNTNAVDKLAITTYNKEFTQYEGTNVKGTTVKNLIDAVNVHNKVNDNSKQIGKVLDLVKVSPTEPDTIKSNATYKVTCSLNTDGYVNSISITENRK